MGVRGVAPALRPFIQGYFFARMPRELTRTRIKTIANGCATLYICLHDTTAQGLFFNGERVAPATGVIGTYGLRHDHVWQRTDAADDRAAVMIRFAPGGFHRLFGIPATETHRAVIGMTDMAPIAFREFIDRIEHARDERARADVLDRHFLALLERSRVSEDRWRRVDAAIRHICSQGAKPDVEPILDHLGCARRTLESQFQTFVGCSPYEFVRIVRFHRLLREIYSAREAIDWADVVFRFGYYDQSHLINEFHDVTTMPPEEFMTRRRDILLLQNHLLFPPAAEGAATVTLAPPPASAG